MCQSVWRGWVCVAGQWRRLPTVDWRSNSQKQRRATAQLVLPQSALTRHSKEKLVSRCTHRHRWLAISPTRRSRRSTTSSRGWNCSRLRRRRGSGIVRTRQPSYMSMSCAPIQYTRDRFQRCLHWWRSAIARAAIANCRYYVNVLNLWPGMLTRIEPRLGLGLGLGLGPVLVFLQLFLLY